MKVDWKEMTMQEKKAGAYNLPGASSCCDRSYDVKGVLVEVPEAARQAWCAQREAYHEPSQNHR